MLLLSPDTPESLRLIAIWLGQKENYQWLDIGDARQRVTPEWLKLAMQREVLVLRIFTSDDDDQPIGVVGLSNVNLQFKTAAIWVVLGEKSFARQGYATRATSKMLTCGFDVFGLRAIHAWIVAHNESIGIAQRVNLKPIGVQRQCHYIDDQPYDRLWFDILAEEHQEI